MLCQITIVCDAFLQYDHKNATFFKYENVLTETSMHSINLHYSRNGVRKCHNLDFSSECYTQFTLFLQLKIQMLNSYSITGHYGTSDFDKSTATSFCKLLHLP